MLGLTRKRPTRLAALAIGGMIGFLSARRAVREGTAWPLAGRVAIVTGGSRGLGLLIARELLDAGCRVAICGRDQDTLDRAVADLGHPAELLAVACDVGDRDDVHRFVARVQDELGPVELLVTNASTINVARIETLDVDHFQAQLHDTFYGALHPILEVIPGMRERGEGHIAVIGSIGGRVAMPHLLPYAAAKFAEVGLSEGLRAELAADGIVVTTVIPGFMRTGSFLAAEYHAPAAGEYAWFAAGATAPLLTISPDWAARRIVRAIRHGEGDVTLGWFARLGGTLKSLMPGLSADVLGLTERWILPDGEGRTPSDTHVRGSEVHPEAPEPVQGLAEPVVSRTVDELNQPPPEDG